MGRRGGAGPDPGPGRLAFSGAASRPGIVGRASLAVLPFANLAGDEATGRLADGLTEDIITDLSRYRNMDVIAHNSTEVYKGKAVDVRQVGKDLNVRYVLEGSVQREGDQIRVTAQLIDAASDAHLWSERWDRPSKDFFAVQSDIADQLGSRLGGGGVIDKAEQAAARRSRPENFTAYELYLAGRSEHCAVHSGRQQERHRTAREGGRGRSKSRPRLVRTGLRSPIIRSFVAARTRRSPFLRRSPPRGAPSRSIRATPWPTRRSPVSSAMQGDFGASEAEFETALRLNPGDAEILALYSALGVGIRTPGARRGGGRSRDPAQSELSGMAGVELLLCILLRRSIRRRAAHPGAAPERQLQLLFLGLARRELCRARPRPRRRRRPCRMRLQHFPDLTIEGFTGTADWQRRRPKTADRADAGRGVPAMRDTRDSGEKPAIGAPARMRVEMNLARRFWRNEAFLALSVK